MAFPAYPTPPGFSHVPEPGRTAIRFPLAEIEEGEAMSKKPGKRGERQKRLEDRPVLGEAGAPSKAGRTGGGLQRKIASRDEEKRAYERPAGLTRVRKRDKQTTG